MPRKVFVAGEILTAAAVNENLMDQSVMSFAGTAARGSAIPTPTEGMVAYLNDSNALTVYDGSAWVAAASGATLGAGSILQVVSTSKTDTFSTSSTTDVDVTGLSATITPRSTSNRVVVLCQISSGNEEGTNIPFFRLFRGATQVFQGDAAGTRYRVSASAASSSSLRLDNALINFVDSPASTSALTYKVTMRVNAGTGHINRTATDTDSTAVPRAASSIILMEVAG